MMLSVIVTAYNVENFIDECIKSILEQTYSDMQVIIVDDGSTDFTPQKCDMWGSRDDRVLVLHKENGGQSDARNYGFEFAKGEYVAYVDGDDWILPNHFELLMNAVNDTFCQIALCNLIFANNLSNIEDNKKITVMSSEECLEDYFITRKHKIRTSVCLGVFDKKLVASIMFPKGRIYEEIVWLPTVISKAKIIACCDVSTYVYRLRNDSTTAYHRRLVFDDKNYSILKAQYEDLIEMLEKNNFCRYIDCVNAMIFALEIDAYCRLRFSGLKKTERFVSIKKNIARGRIYNMCNGLKFRNLRWFINAVLPGACYYLLWKIKKCWYI